MPVVRIKFIDRNLVRANLSWMFLFGDNCMRVGLGGQARAMRGERNAIGIRTKYLPSMEEGAFFSDKQYTFCTSCINEDFIPAFNHVKAGGFVVIPLDGLGTGLSKLPTCAPRVFEFLEEKIKALELLG